MIRIPPTCINEVKAALSVVAANAGCSKEVVKALFDAVDSVLPAVPCVKAPEARQTKISAQQSTEVKACRRYSRHGWCKFGTECRFLHAKPASSGRGFSSPSSEDFSTSIEDDATSCYDCEPTLLKVAAQATDEMASKSNNASIEDSAGNVTIPADISSGAVQSTLDSYYIGDATHAVTQTEPNTTLETMQLQLQLLETKIDAAELDTCSLSLDGEAAEAVTAVMFKREENVMQAEDDQSAARRLRDRVREEDNNEDVTSSVINAKHFAVHGGPSAGVYSSWQEAQQAVRCQKGARCKKFDDQVTAAAYAAHGKI